MKKEQKWLVVLIVVTLLVQWLNYGNLSKMDTVPIVGFASASPEGISGVIPTGTPNIYGTELGISFNDVSPDDPNRANAVISKLGQIDRTVNLEGANLERYINVLYNLHDGTSCEYCCGARSIIFENGQAACGCAHSYAMRGLTKYLVTQHGEEYTDREILEEIGKWKTLFFPTQMQLKAGILKDNGIEFNYINLASNKYRGIEESKTAGGMVGGC